MSRSTTGVLTTESRGLELAAGVPTVVFFSGYPDLFNSFEKVYPAFESTHHIVLCVMPDYEKNGTSTFFGRTFEETVASLHEKVQQCLDVGGAGSVMLVGHDWGSYVAQRYVVTHPDTISKLVLLDVGSGEPKLSYLPVMVAYQLWSALIFIVSRIPILGKFLGLILAAVFPWRMIGPCPHETKVPFKQEHIKVHMTWPYFRIYRDILCRGPKAITPKFQNHIPTCFVYGKRKRIMFHSDGYIAKLAKTAGCESHEFDCGHWIQTQKPDELVAVLRRFLD